MFKVSLLKPLQFRCYKFMETKIEVDLPITTSKHKNRLVQWFKPNNNN